MGTTRRQFNRRDFLSTGITGIAAGGLLGALSSSALSSPVQGKNPESKNKLLCRTLGNTGITVPIVNMGVMNASVPELVKHSYEKWIRLFERLLSPSRK